MSNIIFIQIHLRSGPSSKPPNLWRNEPVQLLTRGDRAPPAGHILLRAAFEASGQQRFRRHSIVVYLLVPPRTTPPLQGGGCVSVETAPSGGPSEELTGASCVQLGGESVNTKRRQKNSGFFFFSILLHVCLFYFADVATGGRVFAFGSSPGCRRNNYTRLSEKSVVFTQTG